MNLEGVWANTSSFGHQIRQVDKDAELAASEVGFGIDLDIEVLKGLIV